MKIVPFLTFSSLLFSSLWGVDFVVTNSFDSGPGSLRQEILDFNRAFPDSNNRITFDTSGPIQLLSDLPALTSNAIVVCPSALRIDGTSSSTLIFNMLNDQITIQLPFSSSQVLLNGGVSGLGNLFIEGQGVLELIGENSYSGLTIIDQNAVLRVSGNGLPSTTGVFLNGFSEWDLSNIAGRSQLISGLLGESGTARIVLGNKALIINDTMNANYPGFIEGDSLSFFAKEGSGVLTLTGNSSNFQGGVGVGGGTLLINGFLGDGTNPITVFPNAILGGSGVLAGNVTNNGSVQPGNSIGTLTINGNYTQNASGELVIEINEAGATDLLDVTGTATLGGTLQVDPEPGLYLEGTTYTFLTAGSVIGQFSNTSSTRPLNYAINYFPNQVQLLIPSNFLVTPPRPNGNAGSVADYLFCSSFDFANTDLDTVAEALLILPTDQYAQALNKLTPSQFGAFALNELENNFSISNSFFIRANQRSYCYNTCDSTNIWVNPIGLVYSQNNRSQISQEATGFINHTYGVVGGVDHVLNNDWKLGFGLGYSCSHLRWKDQAGKAKSDSGYLGPRIGYDCERFYFDLLVLAAGSFYDVDRKIVFPGIDRTASSHPTTWDLSEIALIGFRLQPFCGFFIQPEILLDQLNVFQESFHEKGADSINLAVKRKYTAFLRSLANLKFVKKWTFCSMCLAPSVNVGWLRTTPLTGRHYTAKFRNGTFCEPNFSVTSFDEVMDQVLVSGQFLISSQGCFSMSLGYDGRFGNGSQVNEVNIALDWKF
jgi:autotransporter-associated beta strand protein